MCDDDDTNYLNFVFTSHNFRFTFTGFTLLKKPPTLLTKSRR